MMKASLSPNGTEYKIPTEADSQKELEELKKITDEQRKLGRKIVAVQGMGFVGCVMAAVVADAVDKRGEPLYFVHGQQRSSLRSFWKVPVINRGIPPVSSSDVEVPKIFHRTVVEKKTLRATWLNYAYEVADIVVVDIQLDATKPTFGDASQG
ncbi:nucleotide sugar dehydrogenase, partial [bacterium]